MPSAPAGSRPKWTPPIKPEAATATPTSRAASPWDASLRQRTLPAPWHFSPTTKPAASLTALLCRWTAAGSPTGAGNPCACSIVEFSTSHLTNRLVPSGNLLAAKRESRKKGTPVNQVLKPYRSRHSVVLLLVALGFALKTNAQAPPGPMAGAPSKDSLAPATKIAGPADAPRIKNLSGSWRLNPDESDDPARKLQQASSS